MKRVEIAFCAKVNPVIASRMTVVAVAHQFCPFKSLVGHLALSVEPWVELLLLSISEQCVPLNVWCSFEIG